MKGKALDSGNDIIIENGGIKRVSDAAETIQHVRSRLLFYLEEWFLDLGAGTPYFQQIFIKPVNLANVESILKSRIINTPGVEQLLEFNMEYTGQSERSLKVSFSAKTIYGIIDNDEVTLNV